MVRFMRTRPSSLSARLGWVNQLARLRSSNEVEAHGIFVDRQPYRGKHRAWLCQKVGQIVTLTLVVRTAQGVLASAATPRASTWFRLTREVDALMCVAVRYRAMSMLVRKVRFNASANSGAFNARVQLTCLGRVDCTTDPRSNHRNHAMRQTLLIAGLLGLAAATAHAARLQGGLAHYRRPMVTRNAERSHDELPAT